MSQLFDVIMNEIVSGKRLSTEEYKDAAEENLLKALKASSFSLKEKIEFYKAKWLKDHASILILIGICIIGITLAGILSKQVWMTCLAGLILLAAHCWRNNGMMAYVEKNAYDGTEKN